MKILETVKKVRRGLQLVEEEDARLIEEGKRQELLKEMRKECDENILKADIEYIENFIKSLLEECPSKIIDNFREYDRIKLSLYMAAPTVFEYAFKEVPHARFDRINLMNGDGSWYPKSLNTLSEDFKNIDKENWPPKRIDYDIKIESAYSNIKSHFTDFKIGFETFKKFYYERDLA